MHASAKTCSCFESREVQYNAYLGGILKQTVKPDSFREFNHFRGRGYSKMHRHLKLEFDLGVGLHFDLSIYSLVSMLGLILLFTLTSALMLVLMLVLLLVLMMTLALSFLNLALH